MTQHSQNGEGVDVIQSDREVGLSLHLHTRSLRPGDYRYDTTVADYRQGRRDSWETVQIVARYRQSLAREPATADVGRVDRGTRDIVLEVLDVAANYATAESNGGEFSDQYRRLLSGMNGDVIAEARGLLAAALSRAAPSSQLPQNMRELVPSSEPAIAEGERACHFGGVSYSHADLAIAQRAACAIVPFYGTGDHGEQEAVRDGKLWNDHPVVQGALRALHEARVAPMSGKITVGTVEAIERFITDHAGTDDSPEGVEVDERAQKAVAQLRVATTPPTTNDAIPAGEVERLRKLSDRATPGPWAWEQCGDKEDVPVVGIAFPGDDPDCKAPYEGEFRDSDASRMTIAYDWQSCDGHSPSSNAAFAVAAVNYVRGLLSAAPSAPATEAGEEVGINFEVWEDDMMVAGSTSEADARHYHAVYSQDGPVSLQKAVTVRTVLIPATPTDQVKDAKGGGE